MPPAAALAGSADAIEAQFYEALRRGDIAALMMLWADDDEIVCVHPGGPRLTGAAAIRAGFEAIFAQGGIPVRIEQVRRLQQAGSALHHVVECISIQRADGVQQAWVLASNFYVKTALGWRIAAHHASPGTARDSAHAAADSPGTLH